MAKTEAEFSVNLVEAVEQFPCIYNYRLPEYSRKDLTEKAWAEVAQEVGEKVSTCKEKWKNIRTVFVRKMKQKPSGKSAKLHKPYYLGDMLQFVVPFLRPPMKGVQGEVGGNPTVGRTDKMETEAEEEAEKGGRPTPGPRPQRKAPKRKAEGLPRARSPPGVQRPSVEHAEDDPKKMFLLSLLPELDEMTEQQMRLFRRKVLSLIDDVFQQIPETSKHQPINQQPSPERQNDSPQQQEPQPEEDSQQ